MLSKLSADKKADEAGTGRETLEQYMYTWLTEKYGQKSLVIEWAASIIDVLRLFSKKDNDVLVFGKILRNEIEEDFYWVQQNIKEVIRKYMKQQLQKRYPFKPVRDIDNEVTRIYNGCVTKGMADEIIKYIYQKGDERIILAELELFCGKDHDFFCQH